MAEVLGVVASGIAVAQAIAAGPKVVSFFRGIPEIQGDFDDLRRKVKR